MGGTFIDYVSLRPGQPIRVFKALNQPTALADAILAGLHEVAPDGIDAVVHGTTAATNAIIERKGVRVALVTTAGFADVIEIGRQDRPNLYSLEGTRPPPLVSREMRFEAPERVAATGEVTEALTDDAIADLVRAVAAASPRAVAICLLFSYLAPEHERRLAEAFSEAGCYQTTSTEVMPEHREYERMSTTVANAYVSPLLGEYLDTVSRGLAATFGVHRFEVMQSNGGVLRASEAAKQGVRLLLSGPAGGVAGAFELARRHGVDRIISFDMGGTSTDVALCDSGIPMTTERDVAGVPIRLPMVDIETVGAGGGSIARVDSGGALRVGPESAGADPGPACFGHGTLPTVTDAQAVCGLLDVESFLGGALRVDLDRARGAIAALAATMGGDAEAAAEGVLRVANITIEHAIRRISIERGFDPRDFALVAFGGAGPLHACAVAEGLGIRNVMVPAFPGVMSALGMARADAARDFSQSVLGRADGRDAAWTTLEERAYEALPGGTIQRTVDCRYRGQGYELEIEYDAPEKLEERFHAAHLRRFGFEDREREIEIVTARVRTRQSRNVPFPDGAGSEAPSLPPRSTRVRWEGRWWDAPILPRTELIEGDTVDGPALVVQADSATLVAPDWRARTAADRTLVMERAR